MRCTRYGTVAYVFIENIFSWLWIVHSWLRDVYIRKSRISARKEQLFYKNSLKLGLHLFYPRSQKSYTTFSHSVLPYSMSGQHYFVFALWADYCWLPALPCSTCDPSPHTTLTQWTNLWRQEQWQSNNGNISRIVLDEPGLVPTTACGVREEG